MGPHAITVQVLPRHSSRRRDSAAWRSTPRCRSRETATKIERGCGAAGVPFRVAVRSRAVVALYAAAPAIRALCNGPSRNSRAGPSGHSLRRWDTATGRASLETGRGQRPRRCPVPHGRCSAARGDVRCRRFAILCHAIFCFLQGNSPWRCCSAARRTKPRSRLRATAPRTEPRYRRPRRIALPVLRNQCSAALRRTPSAAPQGAAPRCSCRCLSESRRNDGA